MTHPPRPLPPATGSTPSHPHPIAQYLVDKTASEVATAVLSPAMLELASLREEHKGKRFRYDAQRARAVEKPLRKHLQQELARLMPEDRRDAHLVSQKLIRSVKDPQSMLATAPPSELERREKFIFTLIAVCVTAFVVADAATDGAVSGAIVDVVEEAVDFVKTGVEIFADFVVSAATAIAEVVTEIGNVIANFVETISNLIEMFKMWGGDCPVDKNKIGAAFGDQGPGGLKGAMEEQKMGWEDLRGLVGKISDQASAGSPLSTVAKEGVRVVAGSTCGLIWDAIEFAFPAVTTVVATLKEMQTTCKNVQENEWKNAAITVGAKIGAGVSASAGVQVDLGAGLEVGLGMSMGGQQMCYVGGCVGGAVGAAAKAGVSAGIDFGIAVTIFKDAASIPGTCQTVGITGELSFVIGVGGDIGFGIDYFLPDYIDMAVKDPPPSWDDVWEATKSFMAIGVSFSAGVSVGAEIGISIGVSAGYCWTPICITAMGNGCGLEYSDKTKCAQLLKVDETAGEPCHCRKCGSADYLEDELEFAPITTRCAKAIDPNAQEDIWTKMEGCVWMGPLIEEQDELVAQIDTYGFSNPTKAREALDQLPDWVSAQDCAKKAVEKGYRLKEEVGYVARVSFGHVMHYTADGCPQNECKCVSEGGNTCFRNNWADWSLVNWWSDPPTAPASSYADVAAIQAGTREQCAPDECWNSDLCPGAGYWCQSAKCLWHKPYETDSPEYYFPGFVYENAFKIKRAVSAGTCPATSVANDHGCSVTSTPSSTSEVMCHSNKEAACDCGTNTKIHAQHIMDQITLPCEVQWDFGLANYMKADLERDEELTSLEREKEIEAAAFHVHGRPSDPGCENCLRKGPVWSFDRQHMARGHSEPTAFFGDLQRTERMSGSLERGKKDKKKGANPYGSGAGSGHGGRTHLKTLPKPKNLERTELAEASLDDLERPKNGKDKRKGVNPYGSGVGSGHGGRTHLKTLPKPKNLERTELAEAALNNLERQIDGLTDSL